MWPIHEQKIKNKNKMRFRKKAEKENSANPQKGQTLTSDTLR